MSKTIEFIFDFGSPNAYLADQALPNLVERTGAEVRYVPCLLGGIFKATNNQPPMMAFGGVQGKLAYEQKEMDRFIKKHAITDFQFNPHFPVNTLTLMRAAIAAEGKGEIDAFIKAGLEAMWEDGKNMSDPAVFAETITKKGLDGAAYLASTQDPDVKAKLAENTEAAVNRGVFGIPTFFVGDEMFFGKDKLADLQDELIQ